MGLHLNGLPVGIISGVKLPRIAINECRAEHRILASRFTGTFITEWGQSSQGILWAIIACHAAWVIQTGGAP